MKVFLFNDSRTQNNWGCRATTTALIDLISSRGGVVSGSYELEGLTTLKSTWIGEASKSVLKKAPRTRRLVRGLAWQIERARGTKTGRAWSLRQFDDLAERILSGEIWSARLKDLRDSDVVILNGEGSIYNLEQKGIMTFFLAYFARKYLGKPCALVNHTADLGDPAMLEAAEAVYPLLDDVVFRELISHRNCAKLAPQVQDSYAPDAAFNHVPVRGDEWIVAGNRPGSYSIWPDRADQLDAAKPYICLTGSSSLMRGENQHLSPAKGFAKLIESLSKLETQIVLVAADITDESFLRPLAKMYNLPFVPAATPTPLGLDLLANARCLIGGRWHPSILAATGGTPSVGFSANTYKMRGVLEILGLEPRVYDCFKLDTHADFITEQTDSYIKQGEELRSSVLAAAKAAAKMTPRHVRILERLPSSASA